MTETKPTPDGFLDLEDTRKFAGNPGTSTVYKWMSDGVFPRPYPIGGRRAWKISDLTAWRDSLKQVEYRTKVAA